MKNSRNKELVFNKMQEKLSKITDLVDSDKFPIFSLMLKKKMIFNFIKNFF